MSHQPRRYFVVVAQHDVPRKVIGSGEGRIVPNDRTLEEVVRQRNIGTERPLLGWRTVAGTQRALTANRVTNDDREAGWSVRVYERRQGKLGPL